MNSVSFEVGKGEIFGIIGPNGSGKSTLVRLLSTLLLPDEGQMLVFGNDVVREHMKVRRLINRVSVEASFFKKLSAWENLCYAARLYGVNVRSAKLKVSKILGQMGFSESRMGQSLENLSRGMQQKVAIARAFFTSPVVLLLDEPTTGLDPVSKKNVIDYILHVHSSHETTIILTTHDMAEADKVCHRIAVIDKGRFIEVDSPSRLKKRVSNNGERVTLEDVFFALTGKVL